MSGKLKRLAVASATAVAIIGAGLAVPTTADARGGWHGGGGHWHGGGFGWGGFGIGLGTGLLVGAAAAYPYYGYGPAYGYYGPYAYDYGYPGYGYAGYGYAGAGYGGCTITRRWVSDGHGHRVWRRVRTCR